MTHAIPVTGWWRFPRLTVNRGIVNRGIVSRLTLSPGIVRRGIAGHPAGYWRALLDDRWRSELERVTELSLEFAAAAENSRRGEGPRQLEHRAVAARRRLADIEDALTRLSAGRYGRCEQCRAGIQARRLTTRPEARYCARCDRRRGGM